MNNFITREKRDTNYDYYFTKEIPHQAEHCLLYNPKLGPKPWYCNACLLIFLDLIMFGWIQRYVLNKKNI